MYLRGLGFKSSDGAGHVAGRGQAAARGGGGGFAREGSEREREREREGPLQGKQDRGSQRGFSRCWFAEIYCGVFISFSRFFWTVRL